MGGGKKQGKNKVVAPPAGEEPTSDDWIDKLSAEDRKLAVSLQCSSLEQLELEKEKIAERTKKAQESQRQQLWENEKKAHWEKEAIKKGREKEKQDRAWEQQLKKCIQQAKKEGIIEGEDYGDEIWWMKVKDNTYKEGEDKFYCPHCDKYLNDNTLEAHVLSKGHEKKLRNLGIEPTTSSSSAPKASAPKASAPKAPAGGYGGSSSAAQPPGAKAPSAPPSQPVADTSMYAAPDLPYLAWAPADEAKPRGERWLRCLLCAKWVQDEESHSGTQRAPAGSKEHQKNLRNYGPGDKWYEENVVRERLRHHPKASTTGPPSVSVARPGPASSAPAAAAWGRQPPASKWGPPPSPSAPSAAAKLPPGWVKHTDAASGEDYYHNLSTNETQWEPPPMQPSPPAMPPRS